MQRVLILLLCLFLILYSFASGIDKAEKSNLSVDAVPFTGDGQLIYPEGNTFEKAGPQTNCTGEWQGPNAYVINGWYTGQEYYATYQDPSETGCTNTYRFEVDSVYWVIYNQDPAGLQLIVQPQIYTVELSSPTCPRPGVLQCAGDVYTVNIPSDGAWIVPLEIDCCVEGPYFVAVYCPEYLGTGTIDYITDDGVSSLFGTRSCANFNNWEGTWHDLVVEFGSSYNTRLWSKGVNSDETTCDTCALVVEPGVDLWESSRDGQLGDPAQSEFVTNPIPPDYFGPGSDPFDDPVYLTGAPLSSTYFGDADALLERNQAALLPTETSSDQVDLEVVALRLVSIDPITITYNGGQDPEIWDVSVCLSSVAISPGYIDLTRDCCDGGTFNSQIVFMPKFVFHNDIKGDIVLDFGLAARNPYYFQTLNGVWTTNMHPPYGFNYSEGLQAIDHDCDPATDDILIAPSSKFLRCENIGGVCYFQDPCPCCEGITGDVNCSGAYEPDVSDIVRIIDYLYLTKDPLCCPAEAETNGSCDPEPDISDIVRIIDYLYLPTHTPVVDCDYCTK